MNRLCETLVATDGVVTPPYIVSPDSVQKCVASGRLDQATLSSFGYFGMCGECQLFVMATPGESLQVPEGCLGVREGTQIPQQGPPPPES